MSVTIMSSREFNQDANGARKATMNDPVFIMDRGLPAHVLLSIEAYRKLSNSGMTLLEAVGQTEKIEVDFEFSPPRLNNGIYRAADLVKQ